MQLGDMLCVCVCVCVGGGGGGGGGGGKGRLQYCSSSQCSNFQSQSTHTSPCSVIVYMLFESVSSTIP